MNLEFLFISQNKDSAESEKRTSAPTQEDIFGEELDVSSDEEESAIQVCFLFFTTIIKQKLPPFINL